MADAVDLILPAAVLNAAIAGLLLPLARLRGARGSGCSRSVRHGEDGRWLTSTKGRLDRPRSRARFIAFGMAAVVVFTALGRPARPAPGHRWLDLRRPGAGGHDHGGPDPRRAWPDL